VAENEITFAANAVRSESTKQFAPGFYEEKTRGELTSHLIEGVRTMNTQSPLVPQGTFLEQRNQGRARVKIAVFVVLAIHGIGLLALLMQGCKKEPDSSAAGADQTNTNTAPAFVEPTNMPPASNASALQTNVNNPPEAVAAPAPSTLAPAVVAPSEYKVQRGDTFSTIAKKFHITTKAITDANPGVDPTKLQIGQTLHIPASTVTAPTGSNGTSLTEPAAGEQIYTVQSGDTLIGIAAKFKVTVKALRSLNDLTTDKIKVGQKLKIPAKAVSTNAAPATTTTAPATTTAPTGQ
jgi:LysM repeat protein